MHPDMIEDQVSQLFNFDPDIHVFNAITDDCEYSTVHEYNNSQTSSIKLINFNIRSFNANFTYFEGFLNSIQFSHDFVVLTETWNSTDSVNLCKIDNYFGFHTVRSGNRSGWGGVSIFCLNSYSSQKLENLSVSNIFIETCVVRTKIADQSVVIFAVYRPPGLENISEFLAHLESALSDISIKSNEIIIFTGDLNLNLLQPDRYVNQFVSILNSFSLFSFISKPTRFPTDISSTDPTLLDHIWTNKLHVLNSGIITLDITDHCPCYVHLDLPVIKCSPEKTKIVFRIHKEENIELFLNKLNGTDWNSTILDGNVDESWNAFQTRLDTLYCETFPKKTKFLSSKTLDNPWITNYVKNLIKYKSQYFKLFKLGIISKECNNKFKNKVTSAVREAKDNYYQNLFSCNASNSKTKWKNLNYIMGNTNKPSPLEKLNFNDEVVSDKEIPEKLNEYFSDIGENLNLNLPHTDTVPISFMDSPDLFNASMYLFPVNENECSKVIKNLKLTRSNVDSIPVGIFKRVSPPLIGPLVKLLNISINAGYFPKILKIARITPIFKGGDKCDPGNYRPIASLPFLSKIFEKLLYNRISSFAKRFDLISNCQFGFRKNKSTSDSLVTLSEHIYDSLNSKKNHISVLLDLKKAFDTVAHDILLDKLFHYGIRGLPLAMIRSYLSDRFQYMEINGTKSSTRPICRGVPQGSIMGPLLFIIYINDLPLICPGAEIQLFADDTVVSVSGTDFTQTSINLNSHLHLINDWMKSNRLTLNARKSNVLVFTNKPYNPEPIRIENSSLEYLDSVKFLGVYLDVKMNFKSHTEYLVSKLSRTCGIFYKIRRLLPLESRINFYYAYFQPFLMYCVIIWGGTYPTHTEDIFKLQKRIIRTIGDAGFLDHTTPLFRKFKILKFADLFKFNMSLYMYVHHNDYNPNHNIPTRRRNDPVSKFHRLTSGQHAVSFLGPKIWNEIPADIRNSRTFSVFKHKLKAYFIESYN